MQETPDFRELCRRSGLAVTHQRQVIFESLAGMTNHPCPEEVYERVKEKIPAISLATVYKTLHTFVDHGMLLELSPHHGSLRVDCNLHEHHHLLCTKCKKVVDVSEEELGPLPVRRKLKGFKVERVAVEIRGLCEECSQPPEHQVLR
jgi:Fur family peroxide stress response transcriptional regulator